MSSSPSEIVRRSVSDATGSALAPIEQSDDVARLAPGVNFEFGPFNLFHLSGLGSRALLRSFVREEAIGHRRNRDLVDRRLGDTLAPNQTHFDPLKGAHFCVITQTAIKIHRAKRWSIVARALAMAVWAVCITGSRTYDVRQVRNAPANTG